MKKNLCALMLSGVLLAGCAVKAPVTEPESTPAETTTDVQATEPTQVTEPPETVPATEPTTVVPTEPTAPSETETVPDTETTTPPATEPTTPPAAEPAPKPGELTKPVTKPNRPTEPTVPVTKPTKPAPTEEPTKPEATEPTHVDLSGWTEQNGKRYYLNKDGSVHTGWLTLGSDRYYFHQDGTMAVGKVSVPGSGTRYFTSSGKECILVNPWNYVPEDYTVKLSTYGDYKVASQCLDALKQMLADCKAAGSRAVVVSAYRSHSYQQGLHQRRIQRCLDEGYSYDEAVKEASRHVAVPGTSEHELGLALDIVDVNYQQLTELQETMPAQKWLMSNSWKYGFILRYPNSKSDITGIIYEPWHYRYVGKELAAELHQQGVCLEEYFQRLTQ